MSSFTAFKSPTTFHILSYGTLLGSTVFQSFIGGIVAFRALPRAQFSTLQKSIFPPYFVLQTVTPLALCLTYPRGLSYLFPYFFSGTSSTASTHMSPLPSNSLSAWLIGTMFFTALVNLVYVGPQTTEVMRLRKHQETRDGKKSWDDGPHSKEMQQLNTRFGMLHGVSSLVNLIGLGAMVWYGGCLAEFVSLD